MLVYILRQYYASIPIIQRLIDHISLPCKINCVFMSLFIIEWCFVATRLGDRANEIVRHGVQIAWQATFSEFSIYISACLDPC